MIKIAENPIVRDQVKKVAAGPGESADAAASSAPPPDPPAYPSKNLVLADGRYHVAEHNK